MTKKLTCLLTLLILLSCAPNNMVKSSTTLEVRKNYLEKSGSLMPQRLKDPFIAGKIAEGMNKEMVAMLYGNPNRTENNRYGISWSTTLDSIKATNLRDSMWIYFASDSVSIRRGLVFSGDTLAQILGDSLH